MRKRKSILIVGGSGFVGSQLALLLRDSYKVFATFHANPIHLSGVTTLPMDVLQREKVKRLCYRIEPDAVVYCAGKNDLTWSESNDRITENLHSGGPSTVATVVDIFKPRYIFLSNGYVFDGNRGAYRENDTVLPATAIGKSKLNGENYIRSRSWNHIILRCSNLFGIGTGFHLSEIDQLRMKLSRGERIEVTNQAYYSYAPVSQLCHVVQRLIEGGPRNKVLHYGGLTKTTPFQFAQAFAKRFGFNSELIIPMKNTTKDSDDEKPSLDYSLNCSQLTQLINFEPLLLEKCFDLFEEQFVARFGTVRAS